MKYIVDIHGELEGDYDIIKKYDDPYPLFLKFILDHPDMSLKINYDPVSKGVSLTMEMYPRRKRIVLLPEVIEKLSLDTEPILLEYLENMYKDLDKEIRVWIKEIKEEK